VKDRDQRPPIRRHRGDQIGAAKSLAYSLTYQSDKTMTDVEAVAIRNKIVKRLEQEVNAN
jgi:phenylalanyl-tRNA synthetase beta chain